MVHVRASGSTGRSSSRKKMPRLVPPLIITVRILACILTSSFVRSSRRIYLCQDRPGAFDHRSIDQFAIQSECSRPGGLDRFQDPPGPGPFGFGEPKSSIDRFYLFGMNTELAAKAEATCAYYILTQPGQIIERHRHAIDGRQDGSYA